MRRILSAVVAVVGLVPGEAALGVLQPAEAEQTASEDLPPEQKNREGWPAVRAQRGRITHVIEGGKEEETPGREVGTRRRGLRRTAPRAPVYYATFPTFDTLPDGTRCVRIIRRAYPSAIAAAVAEDTQNLLSRLADPQYPPCSGTPRPATAPAAEAASFWRVAGEDLLPKPQPRIAPGYMLAGKRAYLEANTVPSATFTHPTPLGLLTIEATGGKVYVDWDDGAGLRGPYEGPGEPWPDGKITHFWTDARTYDVRVQQRWTATWRLATGEAGELDALTTEAVLEDFEVRQLQAVRNR